MRASADEATSRVGPAVWRVGPAGERAVTLDRPRLMAILNLTPDSFHAGSRAAGADAAVRAAERALGEGADVLDLGAESTRPGAERVDADEQLRRLVPALQAIVSKLRGLGPPSAAGAATGPLITIDTTLARVARECFAAGADGLNDVSAGTEDEELLPLVAEQSRGVVLMHRVAPPGSDSYSTAYPREPDYSDKGGVVTAVRAFLTDRAAAAERAGIAREAIVLDPGLGFGKSVGQNLELIRRTVELAQLGYPVLSALSRKSFTAVAGGLDKAAPTEARLNATLGLSVVHLLAGARLFRVHDVRAHAEALGSAWSSMRVSND